MKQQITKEQWNELDSKEKHKVLLPFYNNPNLSLSRMGWFPELTIGQLIEFLGDDIYSVRRIYRRLEDRIEPKWEIGIKDLPKPFTQSRKKELIDALWEAVKYKLK